MVEIYKFITGGGLLLGAEDVVLTTAANPIEAGQYRPQNGPGKNRF